MLPSVRAQWGQGLPGGIRAGPGSSMAQAREGAGQGRSCGGRGDSPRPRLWAPLWGLGWAKARLGCWPAGGVRTQIKAMARHRHSFHSQLRALAMASPQSCWEHLPTSPGNGAVVCCVIASCAEGPASQTLRGDALRACTASSSSSCLSPQSVLGLRFQTGQASGRSQSCCLWDLGFRQGTNYLVSFYLVVQMTSHSRCW